MKQVYPTFIVNNGKWHIVYVPDLDINTQGENFINAIEMARDAIGLKGIFMEDKGIELPKPSNSEQAFAKAKENAEVFDYTTGILTFVDIDFTAYRKSVDTKSVRRNVTLPLWLNTEAEKAHINVSGVLQDALMKVLNVSKPN